MQVFLFHCELLLKTCRPQRSYSIAWLALWCLLFQAADGLDEGSKKSPFETAVRLEASQLRSVFLFCDSCKQLAMVTLNEFEFLSMYRETGIKKPFQKSNMQI